MEKALTGAAGEHYVAFRLAAMGCPVGFTPRGTKGADLLVTDISTGKSITLQVKTGSDAYMPRSTWGPYWKWRVGVSRSPQQTTLYYLFVDMKGDPSKSPDVFVVPSVTLESTGASTGLLEEYPRSKTPKTDAWCVIYDTSGDIAAYRDRWDVLQNALA